jgi:diguanylate cyclase (GGDEF)-like protein
VTRPRAAVVVLSRPAKWKEITGDRFIIGRMYDAEVSLVDDAVGRKHARIAWRDESAAYFVEDLGARNVTQLNGVVLRESKLADGDEIRVGDVFLRFVVGSDLEDRVARIVMERERVDPATGLATEEVFIAAIARAAEQASVEGTPLALVTARIDDFAKLRNRHGSLVTTDLQRELGRLVKIAFEDAIVAARVGEARFVIVVPRDAKDAWLAAESLVKMAEASLPEVIPYDDTTRVTISAGMASFETKLGAAALVQASEVACEEAMRLGGGRALSASDR